MSAPNGSYRRLVRRDLEVLDFLCHHRAATESYVWEALWPAHTTPAAARRSLGRLCSNGFVQTNPGPDRRQVYEPTPKGFSRAGVIKSAQNMTPVSFRLLAHTVSVAEAAAKYLNNTWVVPGTAPLVVLSELELAQYVAAAKKSYAATLRRYPYAEFPQGLHWTRKDQRRASHIPDLIVSRGSERHFIEVELSEKAPERYVDLFRGYIEAGLAGTVTRVVYFVEHARTASLLRDCYTAAITQPRWAGTTTSLTPLQHLLDIRLHTFRRMDR